MRQMWRFCTSAEDGDQFSPGEGSRQLYETPFDALAEAPGELLVKVEVDEVGGRSCRRANRCKPVLYMSSL